jgi:signal transduction histidine kinase
MPVVSQETHKEQRDRMIYLPHLLMLSIETALHEFSLIGLPGTILAISIAVLVLTIIVALWRTLARNEKLKYEFITIVAHKFRTPLTHIKWTSDELVKNEQDAYKKQSLTDIQQSNEKLIKLTNTLLELTDSSNTSATAYAFERVSLGDFVRDIGTGFKDMFHEKNIFFSVQCPPEPLFVKIDTQRMEFVIQTMLENALNYSSPGQSVEVHIARNGRHNEVHFIDHGIGIEPQDIPSIFTKFFRTKSAQAMDTEGFGVGLYLAQSIVERHGGKITAYSDGAGKGSTFILSLKRIR